ncbi:hypothetical protein F5888DRAFT_1609567 [Russula emetica]|nr:hypothetical protein F5888DRAFT_1609567 [Russula emetica]
MTSSTGQPPGSSESSPSSGIVEGTLNINGEEIRVIQFPNFSLEEHLENIQRVAARREAPFVPPTSGTPINALPNELLSFIFTLGSGAEEQGDDDDDDDNGEEEDDEEDSTDEHRQQLPFKVLVSHVCRRWRTVAIETPMLWTSLDFAEGPPFDKSRTWLERSKECLLVIQLDCTTGLSLDRVSPADLPVVRDLILPHVARWRVFELMVDDYQIMYGILSTLATIPEAPQLQVLRLYNYDNNDDYDHFQPPHLKQPFAPFCGRAPNLVEVGLWGVHVDWEACAFLRGLEELQLEYHAKDVRPPYEIFFRILRGSPDLHILTLSASGPDGNPEDWPLDVIELTSVKHLILAFVEPSYASALMNRLVFPNLSTLALDFDTFDYSSFLVQLTRPYRTPNQPQRHSSLCHDLVDLKMSGMQCSPVALSTFYASLPNLVSLNLNCYYLPHLFFEYLYPGLTDDDDNDDKVTAGGCYLPKLETLSTSGIPGREMRDLLSKRKAVPLRHVLMDSDADVNFEDEVWLRGEVESFEFFDGSDDEDDDDPVITELDDEEEGGAADGVPGFWV